MESYKIYQIKISDEIHNFVNSEGQSHSSTAEKFPIYEARLETMCGYSRGWSDSYFQHYTKVCELKVNAGLSNGDGSDYEINDVDEVFKVLNYYYADEECEGEDIVLDAHLIKHQDFRSLSVGDLVEDPQGNFYLCDCYGFHKFTNPIPFHDVLLNGWDNSQLGQRYNTTEEQH